MHNRSLTPKIPRPSAGSFRREKIKMMKNLKKMEKQKYFEEKMDLLENPNDPMWSRAINSTVVPFETFKELVDSFIKM